MAKTADRDLSRRERQIMEIVFARGEASVTEIVAALPDPPSDTSVRTFLRILESAWRPLATRSYGPGVPAHRRTAWARA